MARWISKLNFWGERVDERLPDDPADDETRHRGTGDPYSEVGGAALAYRKLQEERRSGRKPAVEAGPLNPTGGGRDAPGSRW
jgi:hypothetical protein